MVLVKVGVKAKAKVAVDTEVDMVNGIMGFVELVLLVETVSFNIDLNDEFVQDYYHFSYFAVCIS